MIQNYKVIILTILIASSLYSCGNQIEQLKDIGKVPRLNKLAVPMLKDYYEPIEWIQTQHSSKHTINYPNSLWNNDSKFFLQKVQPHRVGDIVKVTININDKAELDNKTESQRESKDSNKNPLTLGIEKIAKNILPFGINPLGSVSVNSNSKYKGNGNIDRAETIITQIAAMVTQILPNGNLVIHGDQEISVNYEIRRIAIDGIIQPQDIDLDNSISSNQIAEARILYGGRGHLSKIQQPKIGNQILNIFNPF